MSFLQWALQQRLAFREEAKTKDPVGDFVRDHPWPEGPAVDEVRPIEAELCSEKEARQRLEEFFDRYERGGGANLRVELVSGLPGVRLTLVGDWDDMS